jgi:hypothetical protein
MAGLVAALAVLAVAAIDLLGGIASGDVFGPLALAILLSGHLTLATALVLPFAARGPRRDVVRFAFLVLTPIALLRFGDEWVSLPGGPANVTMGPALTAATWNLEVGARPASATVSMLAGHPADVVALQELTPAVAQAIEADPGLRARYPYRALVPRQDAAGLGILSGDPLRDVAFELGPPQLSAVVALGRSSISVVVVHPFPAAIATGPLGLPVAIDSPRRDADHRAIRATVDRRAADTAAVLLGDLNTASTEPAFAQLAAGLTDAHVAAGVGPGWTWRPGALESLGIGLLRIDVVMTTPGLRGTGEWIGCPPVGDHCLVGDALAWERP